MVHPEKMMTFPKTTINKTIKKIIIIQKSSIKKIGEVI